MEHVSFGSTEREVATSWDCSEGRSPFEGRLRRVAGTGVRLHLLETGRVGLRLPAELRGASTWPAAWALPAWWLLRLGALRCLRGAAEALAAWRLRGRRGLQPAEVWRPAGVWRHPEAWRPGLCPASLAPQPAWRPAAGLARCGGLPVAGLYAEALCAAACLRLSRRCRLARPVSSRPFWRRAVGARA